LTDEVDLRGADLREAQLQGADFRKAKVWQTNFGHEGDMSLSDLRSTQFEAPTKGERAEVLASFDAIPDVAWRKKVAARVEKALTPQTPPWRGIAGVAVHKFVLVDDLRDVRWGGIAQDEKTADEAEYDRALAPYLAKLAETDEFVAKGIAKRLPFATTASSGRTWRGGCSMGGRTGKSSCPTMWRRSWRATPHRRPLEQQRRSPDHTS
jgi:hypothetical protein